MKSLRHIDLTLTARLVGEVLPRLTPEARRLAAATNVYVTHCKAGQANASKNTVRIPSWAFDARVNFCGKGHVSGGLDFAAYYLAHELAHIQAKTGGHGPAFMSAFKTLCPAPLRWYEAIYKPKNAAAAGITHNTTTKEPK